MVHLIDVTGFSSSKGPATRNDFVNDIIDDERADAIFATLKTIVDDGSSTISLRVAGPLVGSHLSRKRIFPNK